MGSERCGSCHPDELARWRGSHHALAMQPATATSVLGEFVGGGIEVRGQRWHFDRRGSAFLVTAEGPDGALHEYTVAYTFGVDPLQQVLVELPGGRLQALSVAWDVRARRWFDLQAGHDATPDDWLHWSQGGQRWNSMCADCHSTHVVKGHDERTDTFDTTFAEVSVGCEACHGPGSLHAAGGAPLPAASVRGAAQVERCARCHARRAQLADLDVGDRSLMDAYIPSVLAAGVYYADGQILDEDFEYQSFLQSKMYARGVGCGDCHDVHSGKLRGEGNALCTRCHDARRFDRTEHHAHAAGAQCVSCHMPARTYMVVHARRDHSLRVPQPELAASVGAPNACASVGCHADRAPLWIADAYARLYGERPRARQAHWGTVLAAGRASPRNAGDALVALATDSTRPAIARASALDLLGGMHSRGELAALQAALADPDPLIRYTAASRFPADDPGRLLAAMAPLLGDPVRAVRVVAAARCTELPAEVRAGLPRFDAALAEAIASERYASDMPSGPYDLGNLYANLGQLPAAEHEYRRALGIDSRFTPAKVNLAQLLSTLDRGDEAIALLRSVAPDDPGAAEAALDLGLLLAEAGRTDEAEVALRRAVADDSNSASAAFNLAALIARRSPKEALELFGRAAALEPDEPRYACALATELAAAGDRADTASMLRTCSRGRDSLPGR